MAATKLDKSLILGALGVVYGDIGTSPLYTLSACFGNIAVSAANILGVMSLIFWSLILVVSTCYVSVFLNASNDGEGGVLALLGLLKKNKKSYRLLFYIGIFGAGLLISDGMLTPAISVISAMEGLTVISPSFSHYIIPLTISILLILFFCQRFGTQKIGFSFGPILLVWFIVIGLFGLRQIHFHPEILKALNPYYAIQFFINNGFKGWLILGSVFLCITGAEAMYADLGQFGKTAIRLSWFFIVLPSLLLCFFGEGADLLVHPDHIRNAFYLSAPEWCQFPLIFLAALATIIASQSIISASYSLTRQGILLGVMPRLKVIQTSIDHCGQIYVPRINAIFAMGTIFLVLFFKSSNSLTSAYGIAINMEMLIMTILVIYLAYEKWSWSKLKIISVFLVFVIIDLGFLSSNLFKIPSGGWLPLVFAMLCLLVMITWRKGIALLQQTFKQKADQTGSSLLEQTEGHVGQLLADLEAVLITNTYDHSGSCFLKYFDNMHTKPRHWLILTVLIDSIPRVAPKNRYVLSKTAMGASHLILHFGFMETIHIPDYLAQINQQSILPFQLNLQKCLYFIEDIAISPTSQTTKKVHSMFQWQKNWFIFMFSNTSSSLASLEFLKLPKDQTIMIGAYADL